MSEGLTGSPAGEPGGGFAGVSAARQDVSATVRRVMGEDIAPPENGHPGQPPARPVGAGRAPASPAGQGDSSTTVVAKEQAGEVADTAQQAGAQVLDTVAEQAGEVTAEAGRQAKQLLSQAQSELTEQAAVTERRAAAGLESLAQELRGMADASDQDGLATDVARQAADRAGQVARWLEDRDPGALLDEVRSFARRRPGTYLALAAGAGVLAGRLTRGLSAPTNDSPNAPHTTAGGEQASRGQAAVGVPPPVVSAPAPGPDGTDLWPRPGLDPEPALGGGRYPTGAVGTDEPLVGDDPVVRPVSGPGARTVVGGPRGDLPS